MTNNSKQERDIKNFGFKLQDLRILKGMTIEDLAEELDISARMVSYYESGTKIPSVKRLIEISKIFNVSVDELLLWR